ncbi:substrate-binding domain-containing protein [Streptosporangium sp. NPDC003464]
MSPADHLIARGCRRIATITGPLDVPVGQDRLAGYRDAMAMHGPARPRGGPGTAAGAHWRTWTTTPSSGSSCAAAAHA